MAGLLNEIHSRGGTNMKILNFAGSPRIAPGKRVERKDNPSSVSRFVEHPIPSKASSWVPTLRADYGDNTRIPSFNTRISGQGTRQKLGGREPAALP